MSRRRAIVAVAGLAGATLVGSACRVDINTGDQVTRTIDVEEFDELTISSAFDVSIEIGPEASLEVTIPEQVLDDLVVEHSGNRLSLGFDRGLFSTSPSLEAVITTPSLQALELSGAVDADLDDLDADEFRLDLSGASKVDAGGSVGVLVIDASGASSVDFGGVTIDRVEVDASGASRVEVPEATEVDGELSGASVLEVGADTSVSVETSGASTIREG